MNMTFTKTFIEKDYIKISDLDNGLLLMRIYDKNARIMYCSGDESIIKAGEKAALEMGKSLMVYDFPGSLEGMSDVLNSLGYTCKNGKKIMSVNTKELFSSTGVTKSVKIPFRNAQWAPFRDLLVYQFEEILNILKEQKIPIDRYALDRFDDDLSGVVYDNDHRPQAVILSSVYGKEILVELLLGFNKNNPEYVMASMQGFAKELIDGDMLDIYDIITMFELNNSISPLLKRLLDKEYDLFESGYAVHAEKKLSQPESYNDIEMTEKEPFGRFVLSEEARSSYQDNINAKMQWQIDEIKTMEA